MITGLKKNGLVEPELALLKRVAQEFAQRRRENVSTAHLLAAIAVRPSPAADLLRERKIFPEDILRQAGDNVDGSQESVRRVVERARGIAARMGATHASAEHVLIALLNEQRGAARQIVEQSGCDAGRLRTLSMSLAQGLVSRRPQATKEQAAQRAPASTSSAAPASSHGPTSSVGLGSSALGGSPRPLNKPKGVAISLFPPERAKVAPSVTPAVEPSVREPAASAPPEDAAPSNTPSVFELDPRRYPTLCEYGRNLTFQAALGRVDRVVGREHEMDAILDILAKRHANNPCLVGLPGVGKTSVVRGLALRMAERALPRSDERIIVELPVGDLLAGTGVRGALAARFAAIRKEVAEAAGRIVLFFDEIHQLFMGDAADEIASEFKQALAAGLLPCIGATTHEDFARTIGSDAALARRFAPVDIEEPSREEAYLVLESSKKHFEQHHQLQYSAAALALSIAWSVRYLPGRALPDKALSVIDLAGARVRRRGGSEVKPEHVAEVVSNLSEVPVERLLESDGERLLRLEQILGERVVGHEAHLRRIAGILRRNAAGLGSARPIGTFLLLGPTGVGKTETAKAIAEVLFHDERAMTRLDLSEFSESHAVARLIGAPPGYVGHEAGGQLTEAVRKRPYQVILLDELEKAHADVLTAFLGVFDEGRLTDGRGRTVDFSNTVILMTSNLGTRGLSELSKRRLGFSSEASDDLPTNDREVERQVMSAVRSSLPPELYNRIDEALVFLPLTRPEVRRITERLLAGVERALAARHGIRLDFDASLIEHLLEAGGFDAKLGARPMKRTIGRLVETPLADKILSGEAKRGDVVLVHCEAGEILFDLLGAAEVSELAGNAAE